MRIQFLAALVLALGLAACSSGKGASPDVVVPPAWTPTAGADPTPTAAPSGEAITAPFDLPVVMYHDISPAPPDDVYRAASNVLPADFAAQLDYLRCAGYNTVTPTRLADAIEGRAALPEKPVILTFDDGYSDHYTQAFPLLQERGMVGAFAIITGFVEGGGDYMSWAQIREMADAGMEIMSHTVTHIDLNTADDGSALAQLRDSRAAIQERTGKAPAFLVYPAGEPFRSGTVGRQAQVVSMAAEAGYRGAFLAGPSVTTQDPAQPFALNRVRVGETTDLATFAALVGGPPPGECGG